MPSRLICCKRIGVLSRLVELEESVAENSTILMHLVIRVSDKGPFHRHDYYLQKLKA